MVNMLSSTHLHNVIICHLLATSNRHYSCLIYADRVSGIFTELDILCYIEYLIELDINSVSSDINKYRKVVYLEELDTRSKQLYAAHTWSHFCQLFSL